MLVESFLGMLLGSVQVSREENWVGQRQELNSNAVTTKALASPTGVAHASKLFKLRQGCQVFIEQHRLGIGFGLPLKAGAESYRSWGMGAPVMRGGGLARTQHSLLFPL